MTDLERDLARVEAQLSRAAPATAGAAVADAGAVTRVVHLHLQRAGLTGRPESLDVARRVAEDALDSIGPWPDLVLLRVDLHLRVHEVAAARRELCRDPALLVCTQGRALLADVALQTGRVDEAEELVGELVATERTWDHLARLAHVAAVRGDLQGADDLYLSAEDELTAKSMRSFAWVELERGRLRLLAGEPGSAMTHYTCADRAYTGLWAVQERMAEVDALAGRTAEAASRLEDVLARTGRPEVSQSLATLYVELGDEAAARRHRRRAMGAFLTSARRGEARYLHHLAQCAPPAEAVGWARHDVELRPNHLTRSTLALALLRDGRATEATSEMTRALDTGLRDPRLLRDAAEVLGLARES